VTDLVSSPTAEAMVGSSALTSQQLQGLARLGDMAFLLTEGLPGASQGALSNAMVRGGEWYARYDLPELLDESLAALDAMRRAGLLRAVRDNAAFVAETAEHLAPLFKNWIDLAQDMPWQRLREHIHLIDQILSGCSELARFTEKYLAGDLTELSVRLGEIWADTEADEVLREVLETAATLRKNGTFRRLCDLSSQFDSLVNSVDLDSLAAEMVGSDGQDAQGGLTDLLRLGAALLRALDQAIHAGDDKARLGGFSGLLKMIRDPAFQQGMQVFARIPQEIKRQTSG